MNQRQFTNWRTTSKIHWFIYCIRIIQEYNEGKSKKNIRWHSNSGGIVNRVKAHGTRG